MFLARIDNRLIHGQVIESWLPYTGAKTLAVADEELAQDTWRQEIMSLAIPNGVDALFMSPADAFSQLKRLSGGTGWPEVLLLFADCCGAKRAYENGLEFPELNIGNLHYGPGKRQLLDHVAVSGDDLSCLNFLQNSGVQLDFRCLPGDRNHFTLAQA